MPELVELRKEFPVKHLAMIGLNFDEDIAQTRKSIKACSIAWPQVHALTCAKGDATLWEKTSGINFFPRMILMDENGIVRADGHPMEIIKKARVLLSGK